MGWRNSPSAKARPHLEIKMELVKRKKLVKRSTANQVKKLSKAKIKPRIKEKINTDMLIPTSSTLLNCACSDNPFGGYGIGKIVNLIGDSSSGKTLLGLSCFAEMSMFKKFDDYALIYDDVEAALEFNLEYLFGFDISDRIDMSYTSDTVQDFYGNIKRTIKEERPFVYILDSLDALTSVEEMQRASVYEKLEKDRTEKEKKMGSYKMEKAKLVSEILRVVARDIKRMEALVIVISQTRDNVGFGFSDKTRSGGRALKFYSSHEMWLSVLKPIRKKNRIIGVDTKAKISKNKLTGKVREVSFPIYYDYGVDDLTANIDFLVSQGHWKKKLKGTTINAPEFDLVATREKIIQHIELNFLEKELQEIVGETWNNIEEEIRLDRKPKYIRE